LLLPVAIISARMVSQEREKRTLECLLMTDLDAKEILFGKWWASIFPMRWILFINACALSILALGKALHPLGFLFLIAAALVYTCFVACVGLLISTLNKTVFNATMVCFVTLIIFVSAGPLGLFSPAKNPENLGEWLLQCVLSYALSPIDAMRVLAFDSDHLELDGIQILAALSGVVLVGLGSWGIWKLTLARFEKVNRGQ
jgi:ABC-type transport system involved in multi-copper enzyme maturation permease subunit